MKHIDYSFSNFKQHTDYEEDKSIKTWLGVSAAD